MLDRRNVLKTLAAAPIFGSLAALQSWGNEYQAKENRRPRVAAIYTSLRMSSWRTFYNRFFFAGKLPTQGSRLSVSIVTRRPLEI